MSRFVYVSVCRCVLLSVCILLCVFICVLHDSRSASPYLCLRSPSLFPVCFPLLACSCVCVCCCVCQRLDRLDALMSTMIKARRAAPHREHTDLLGTPPRPSPCVYLCVCVCLCCVELCGRERESVCVCVCVCA